MIKPGNIKIPDFISLFSKKYLPLVLIALIVVLYLTGVRNYREFNEELKLKIESTKSEVAKLQKELADKKSAKASFFNIAKILDTEDNTIRKVISFYPTSIISIEQGYIILDFSKLSESEVKTDQQFNRMQNVQIIPAAEQGKLVTIEDTKKSDKNKLLTVYWEVKKCQEIFQQACVIVNLYPLKLKVYYLSQ